MKKNNETLFFEATEELHLGTVYSAQGRNGVYKVYTRDLNKDSVWGKWIGITPDGERYCADTKEEAMKICQDVEDGNDIMDG